MIEAQRGFSAEDLAAVDRFLEQIAAAVGQPPEADAEPARPLSRTSSGTTFGW